MRTQSASATDCTQRSLRTADSLSDLELLGELIGSRRSRRQFSGSFDALFEAKDPVTVAICGIAREFIRRWLNEQLVRESIFTQPRAVRDYLRLHYSGQEFESFVCLFLDAQNRLIRAEELFRGTLTQTSVYPREVVKAALRHNAAAIILSHNHPSGVAEPSMQDQALTRTLIEALAIVDVKILDHFVIAGPTALSFAERGLI